MLGLTVIIIKKETSNHYQKYIYSGETSKKKVTDRELGLRVAVIVKIKK